MFISSIAGAASACSYFCWMKPKYFTQTPNKVHLNNYMAFERLQIDCHWCRFPNEVLFSLSLFFLCLLSFPEPIFSITWMDKVTPKTFQCTEFHCVICEVLPRASHWMEQSLCQRWNRIDKIHMAASEWQWYCAFFSRTSKRANPSELKVCLVVEPLLVNINKCITILHIASNLICISTKFEVSSSHIPISCWGCHNCLFNSCMQVSLYIILEKKLC